MAKSNLTFLSNALVSMRPKQWIKNSLIFVALIFSQNLFHWDTVLRSILSFMLFCLVSSGIYLFNDLMDAPRDREHPVKKNRPIASGTVSRFQAVATAILLEIISLWAAFELAFEFGMVCVVYIVIQILYSLFLKKIVIIEIFTVAAGFFLRVIAGAKIIEVPVSSWLLVCTLFISLFLGLAKRRSELILLGEDAKIHRGVLDQYSISLMDQMVGVATAGSVISYSLYTLSSETVGKFGTENLWYTIPIVIYGIFRYLYLIYRRGKGGFPELIFFEDRPLLITGVIYVIVVVLVIYL